MLKKGLFIILLFSCIILSLAQKQTALPDSIIVFVADKQIPLNERIELLAEIYPRTKESVEGLRRLLNEAREYPDKKYMLRAYRALMFHLRTIGNQKESSLYVDSVLLYIDKVSDPTEIGMAYYQLGTYHSRDYSTAHSYRYKAIPYFEKSPENRYRIAEIYYHIAADYNVFKDYDNMKEMEVKLFELSFKCNVQEALVWAYSVKSACYRSQYELDKSAIAMRDLSIFYEQKAIEAFEKIKHSPSEKLYQTISDNYQSLAFALLLQGTQDGLEKSLEYIEKSLFYAPDVPENIYAQIGYHNIRGNIFLKQGKLKEAEKEALALLDVLPKDADAVADFPEEYRKTYELLSEVAEAKGNYKEALKYNRLLNEHLKTIFDSERYEAIENVKTQYEVSKKEDEIAQLIEINHYQKRISYLYLILGILFVSGLLFFIYSLLLKRKNVIAQLQIAQLEKDEAEAQISLKEEILKRSELEKYEALLNIHFKEQELTEQEQALKSLLLQKEELEEQILKQAKKLEKFETHLEQIQTKFNSRSISGFLEEMKQLIRSKLGNNNHTKMYLQNMDKIDDALLFQIDTQSEGKLALVHLRYCVCFIIGMSIKDVADCFSVEVSSVHTTRHRLKQRLNLDKEDLDIYFKSLLPK
ncbi:MAG: hypothetical protein LBI82_11245 [Dysgonamonadaceae bacterium]|jgi:tetratricopeptide (TPR) repeat protein|nr:hypothetical protein [Dysgonamonadaceae bacterium]